MKILRVIFISLSFIMVMNSGVHAEDIKDGNKIGIVMMQGKGGTTKWVDSLSASLDSVGVQVVTPDMPWHKDRIYAKSFDDSMIEIKGHVDKLKSKGATKIFVAGHSLGAVAAAGYAAKIGDIQGIILLAPGHFTNVNKFKRRFVDDLEKSDSMISSGKGNTVSDFKDINSGGELYRDVAANIYQSWFSPTGPAEFVTNMKNVKKGISILYVAGREDRLPKTKSREYAFDKAPSNEKSQFTIIDSGHLDVPELSADTVIEWLRKQ